jgi:uncharacterized protein (DUF58 family)
VTSWRARATGIAPRAPLLWWVAAVGLPAAFLAAVPALLPVAALLDGVLLVVVLGDAFAGRRRVATLSAELPAAVRLTRGRAGEVAVDLVEADPPTRSFELAIGLMWPATVVPERDIVTALVPAGERRSQLRLGCTPERRGRYPLTELRLERGSPLGLWAIRKHVPVASELRVYPDLLAERKSAPALFLHRGGIGLHAHRQVGKGREFERLREYQPGDGYDELHWKATAKKGRPVTKLYQVERTQEVYAVLDISRLAARPSGDPPKPALERTLNAALLLALAAERQGDLFGTVVFAERVRHFVPARGGKGHFQTCREALYAVEPQPVSPDFEELASFLRLRLRRRALLVILTALDDPILAEGFQAALRLIRRQHLIVVCSLSDGAVAPLFQEDAENLDAVYASLAGHLRWESERELQASLGKVGVAFAPLAAEALAAGVVSRYADVKRRQLL